MATGVLTRNPAFHRRTTSASRPLSRRGFHLSAACRRGVVISSRSLSVSSVAAREALHVFGFFSCLSLVSLVAMCGYLFVLIAFTLCLFSASFAPLRELVFAVRVCSLRFLLASFAPYASLRGFLSVPAYERYALEGGRA